MQLFKVQKLIFDILPKTRTAANLLDLSASAAQILSMSLLCFVPLVACLSPSCCALLPPSASYNFSGHCPRAEPCRNFLRVVHCVPAAPFLNLPRPSDPPACRFAALPSSVPRTDVKSYMGTAIGRSPWQFLLLYDSHICEPPTPLLLRPMSSWGRALA